jgi:hypothetical protein
MDFGKPGTQFSGSRSNIIALRIHEFHFNNGNTIHIIGEAIYSHPFIYLDNSRFPIRKGTSLGGIYDSSI